MSEEISEEYSYELEKNHEKVKTKDYYIHRDYLSIKLKDDPTCLLMSNFIKSHYFKPSFNVVLEFKNTTNVSHEALIPLGRLPIELLFGETDLSEFIIEKTTDDNTDTFNYPFPSGFFIDLSLKDKSGFLTLYDYITPFKIIQNKIVKIKKTKTLYYWLFYNVPEETKSDVGLKFINLYLESKNMNDELIDSFITSFNLNITIEVFRDILDNAFTLMDKTERLIPIDNFHSFRIDNEYVLKIYFDLYFLQDIEKQIDMISSVIRRAKNNLEHIIVKILEELKNDEIKDTEFFKYENINMLQKKLMKDEVNDLKYLLVRDEYNNSIIKYICEINDISFGKNLLILKEDDKFSKDKILSHMNNFESKIIEIIKKYKNNIETFFYP